MSTQEGVYIRVFKTENEVTVAACDVDILGRTLVDSSRKIKFYVDPSFFRGDLKSIDELLDVLKTASNATLVGKRTVQAALKAGYVHPDAVLVVEDVPIALFTRI